MTISVFTTFLNILACGFLGFHVFGFLVFKKNYVRLIGYELNNKIAKNTRIFSVNNVLFLLKHAGNLGSRKFQIGAHRSMEAGRGFRG